MAMEIVYLKKIVIWTETIISTSNFGNVPFVVEDTVNIIDKIYKTMAKIKSEKMRIDERACRWKWSRE